MLIKNRQLKELLIKHGKQLIAIYAINVLLNVISYIGTKTNISFLTLSESFEGRLYAFVAIFMVIYAIKHWKGKTFAFTPLWEKKEGTLAIAFSWLAVVIVIFSILISLEVFDMTNYFIYKIFDNIFDVRSQITGTFIRTFVNVTIVDAITSWNFIGPFIIANICDRLFDRKIVAEGGEKIYKNIRGISGQERADAEGKVLVKLFIYCVIFVFPWIFMELAYCGGSSMSDVYLYFMGIVQLSYLFVLGMNGSLVGLGFVAINVIYIIVELTIIQAGIISYGGFVAIFFAMSPVVCASAFSWAMNIIMQGGFSDISRHHTYLYMIPGLIIFISIYLFGVLGHILQKKFTKTVDKSL